MTPVGQDGHKTNRERGEFWEDRFCEIARDFGWEAWPFQRIRGSMFTAPNGKRYICPDVWILRRGNIQYACEIKHKNACRWGYGFEVYRADSMMAIERDYTNQLGGVIALYVVHNHSRAGGKFVETNRLQDWDAQRLSVLEQNALEGKTNKTYYNGDNIVVRDIHYYGCGLFASLETFLGDTQEFMQCHRSEI